MKQWDLVRFRDAKRTVHAVAVRIAADPDRLSVFLERTKQGHAKVWRSYLDGVTVEGAIIAGKQHLDHDQSALRTSLIELARSEYGKQKIIEATRNAPLQPPSQEYRPTRRGRLADDNVPVDNRAMTTQVVEGERSHPIPLERYMAHRDPKADAADVGPGAWEIRYLDGLRKRNERYYRAYLGWVIEQRPYSEIATTLGTSEAQARKVVSRAKRVYEQVARETQMVNIA